MVNIDCKRRMLCSHLVCVCVLHHSCVYVVTLSYHHSIFFVFLYQSRSHSFHLPWPISFISSTIVHAICFLDHNQPFIFAAFSQTHVKTQFCLNNPLIRRLKSIKTYASKPDSANIKGFLHSGWFAILASKKIGALICSMKFYYPEVAFSLCKSTIRSGLVLR